MLSKLLFYDRRKKSVLPQINDRRNGERRQKLEDYSPERRRLASTTRCEEREVVVIPVRLEIDGRGGDGYTANISHGGMMIQIKTPLRKGLEVFLHFSSRQDTSSICLFGRTVFSHSLRDRGPLFQEVGIQFETLSEFDQKVLTATFDLIRKGDRIQNKSGITILISKERSRIKKHLPPSVVPLVNKAVAQIRERPISQLPPPDRQSIAVADRREKRKLRFTADPDWVIKMRQSLEPYRQAILQSRLIQETSRGALSLKQIQGWSIQFYPFIHSIPHLIALNLARANDPISRTYLIDNIRLEKHHADQWIDMTLGFGVSLEELSRSPILAEVEALTHWLWSITTRGSFTESVAAMHYSIEGITQEIAAIMIKGLRAFEWVQLDRKACKWMEAHTRYDRLHPFKALEIIKLHAVSPEMQKKVHDAAQRSLEYLFLAMEACYATFA